ncbi:hypothetical protein BN1048_01439 [Jeotgalicoccus saudimassiliensis]|uniref:Uncharacterized protein n=1 Tax=Jeotgalicoccus saudimassiliensis TaxID=1461582 RepID=A0A078M5Z5_9STAP|nr:hypothetical protein [Jeotgalicoccus saudimassiliensis]CEA01634.1 hypothetical protein BN1048_01439 [Jeotgalicoccus saudimassiliensis]
MRNMVYVIFGVLGVIISLVFLVLLLFPGSPAALTAPSYYALLAWTVLGLIFLAAKYKTLKSMTKEELDYMILNKTREEAMHQKK